MRRKLLATIPSKFMNRSSFRSLLERAWPHLLALAFLALVACFFYAKSFDGFQLRQGDVQQYKGMSKELSDHKVLTGVHSGWTGSMFGGMPSDQISKAPDSLSVSRQLHRLVQNVFGSSPVATLWWAMLAAYLLALAVGANPLIATFCAVAFGLSTVNILYLGAGHNTKVRAIALMPGVLAGVLWAYRRNVWRGAALAALFTALHVAAGHPQMTYYLLFLMVGVGITEIVGLGRESGQWKRALKPTLWLMIAGIVGVLPSLPGLIETKAYAQHTMRGDQILAVDAAQSNQGLATDYILEYSMAAGEWWSIMCPDIKGGNDPLYWGEQRFSGGAFYFGAIACLLCLVFLLVGRDRLKWPLLLVSILAVLLSRREPSALMEFFLDSVPFYNQFRDTKMMLVVVQLSVVLGAGLALRELLGLAQEVGGDRKKALRRWAAGFVGLFALFGAFYAVPETFFEFQSSIRPDRAIDQLGFRQAVGSRIELFRADVLRTMGLWLVAGLVVAAWMQTRRQNHLFLAALVLLGLADLWSVDRRYSNDEMTSGVFRNWVKSADAKFPFSPSPAMMGLLAVESAQHPEIQDDAQLLLAHYESLFDGKRTSRSEKQRMEVIAQFGALRFADPFRVFKWGSPFNDAETSYFFQSVGGYHGAKLRRYQDFIDRVLLPEGMRFVDVAQKSSPTVGMSELVAHKMLNTRYILFDQMDEPLPVSNPNGAGWVATNWSFLDSPDQEIDAVAALRDSKAGVIHREFEMEMDGLSPGANGGVDLVSYAPDFLEYEVNIDKEALVVFSEMWYPAGWTVKVDGKLVSPIRVNYVFRGLRVPSGSHEVVWEYQKSSSAGWSGLANLLLLLFVGGGFWMGRGMKSETPVN